MIYVAYIPDVPAWAQGLRSVGSGNYIAMSENIDIFSSSGSERTKRKIEKGISKLSSLRSERQSDLTCLNEIASAALCSWPIQAASP